MRCDVLVPSTEWAIQELSPSADFIILHGVIIPLYCTPCGPLIYTSHLTFPIFAILLTSPCYCTTRWPHSHLTSLSIAHTTPTQHSGGSTTWKFPTDHSHPAVVPIKTKSTLAPKRSIHPSFAYLYIYIYIYPISLVLLHSHRLAYLLPSTSNHPILSCISLMPFHPYHLIYPISPSSNHPTPSHIFVRPLVILCPFIIILSHTALLLPSYPLASLLFSLSLSSLSPPYHLSFLSSKPLSCLLSGRF